MSAAGSDPVGTPSEVPAGRAPATDAGEVGGAAAEDLDAAAELIRGADALLVCAGAGMGVDSGLPDYRGPEGFWRAYPPYRALGLRFHDLAGPVHFVDDPPLAWGFYGHRQRLYRDTPPHEGFAAALRWARHRPTRVFTSNVDGQFQRAGFPPETVAEAHGTIHHLQCLAACGQPVWPADDLEVTIDEATMRAEGPLPGCPRCGALARPNILMFGDLAWDDRHAGPRLAGHVEWLRGLRRDGARLAVVEVGAGTAVPTVRRQSELAAATHGALVRINVAEPEIRYGHGVGIGAPAAAALTALDRRLGGPSPVGPARSGPTGRCSPGARG